MELFKIDKYLAFALIFALLNMGAIFFIFGFQEYGDSQDYFQAIKWFGGNGDHIDPERALRPLGPILALPFEFIGQGAGLIAQNILFYLLSAVLIFKIAELIFQDKKQALIGSLLFVTATPIIDSGLAYLTDMGAWFFYLLSIFLTLLYFKNKNELLIILNGFLSGSAVLMKENGGLGIIFFGLMIMLAGEFSIKQKALKIAKFTAFFLIPIVSMQLIAFEYFRYTSIDWYKENVSGAPGENFLLVFLRYFGQLFRVLGIVWIFVLLGAVRELTEKNRERLKIYLALIPSSFSFLLWTVGAGGRAAFIFAPLGILLASFALKKRGSLFLSAAFLAIIALNYWFVSVNQQTPFIDLLYTLMFSKEQ